MKAAGEFRVDWRSFCRKVSYLSEDAALKALAAVKADRRSDPTHTRPEECAVYLCPRCRRWHLTSQAQHRDRD